MKISEMRKLVKEYDRVFEVEDSDCFYQVMTEIRANEKQSWGNMHIDLTMTKGCNCSSCQYNEYVLKRPKNYAIVFIMTYNETTQDWENDKYLNIDFDEAIDILKGKIIEDDEVFVEKYRNS